MLTKPATEAFKQAIFSIRTEEDFNRLAIDIFRFQMEHAPVYARFVQLLHPGFSVQDVSDYRQIPFIPIDFFKSQKIVAEGLPVQDYFMSSGTTSQGMLHPGIPDFLGGSRPVRFPGPAPQLPRTAPFISDLHDERIDFPKHAP